jgi:hypothetical protein
MKAIVKKSSLTLAVMLQLGAYAPVASAQMARPEKFFAEPVPKALLTPYTEFLSRLGVENTGAIISESGFGYIGSGSIGFRVEDKNTCADDKCLTIAGRVVAQRFVAETMFFAGATANVADTGHQLLGVQTFPYFFYSPNGNVALTETPEGWVVAPAK